MSEVQVQGDKEQDPKEKNYTKQISILIGLVLFSAIIYYLVFVLPLPHDKRGTFGDSFGAFTSIITGITLALIWISIKQTQDELRSNRIDRAIQIDIADKHAFASSMDTVINVLVSTINSKAKSTYYILHKEARLEGLKGHSNIVNYMRFLREDDRCGDLITAEKYDDLVGLLRPEIRSDIRDRYPHIAAELVDKSTAIELSDIVEFLRSANLYLKITEVRRDMVEEYVDDYLNDMHDNSGN